jgi:FkbM family methyltransferase
LLASDLQLQDTWVQAQGRKYLIPSLRESVGFCLLVDGVYESEILDFIFSCISGGTIIDVGANIGCITIPVAHQLGSKVQIVAVEASPKVFDYLKRNIAANNLENVILLNCAITATDYSHVQFYEPPSTHFGMGSIAPQFHDKPITVGTRTLDSILADLKIDHVDLIKVDVEGYESFVFQGAHKLLTSAHPPIIIFEFCDWAEERVTNLEIGDSQRTLVEYGYSIYRLYDILKSAQPLPSSQINTGFHTLVAIKHT